MFTISVILLLTVQVFLYSERPYFKQHYTQPVSELNYSKLIVKVKNLNEIDNLLEILDLQKLSLTPYFDLYSNNSFSITNPDNFHLSKEISELTKYFKIDLSGLEIKSALELANILNTNPEIYIAYFEPHPAPPSANTPDFRSFQLYWNPSDVGVGYSLVKNLSGAKGNGVRYCDVEYATIMEHEDFDDSRLKVANPDGSVPSLQWHEHGAAVLGIAHALENEYGIDGMIPDAEIYIAYPTIKTQSGSNYDVARAILDATEVLEFGDIMLLEQQTTVPYPQSGRYGPVEYFDANFDAIKLATAKGITVIEAGGNGSVNLDTNFFNGKFDRNVRNSGAIMVAAASMESNNIMYFSPYGSRIDLYASGEKITTAGYGNAFKDPNSLNRRDYTHSFGGTSGASAILAPTAVSLQGMFYALTGNKLGPQEMRDILFETGIESNSPHKYIGRMPDLSKAYQYILDNYSVVKETESFKEIEFATINSNRAIQILNWSPELINRSLEIYDFLGRKVVQFNSINFETIELDDLRIESGIYFIVSGNSRYKFIKL